MTARSALDAQMPFDFFTEIDQGLRRADSPRSGKNARNATEASKRAAIAIVPTSGTQRFKVLEVIVDSGRRGRTQWEIVDMANVLRTSSCARVKELEENHFIRRSGQRVGPRGTDESVYHATERGVRAVARERAKQVAQVSGATPMPPRVLRPASERHVAEGVEITRPAPSADGRYYQNATEAELLAEADRLTARLVDRDGAWKWAVR